MPLYIMGVVTALACHNSSHMSVSLYKLANAASSDPLSCTPVQATITEPWK